MGDPRELLQSDGARAVGRWFARYRPFILSVLCIVLIAVFLPGRDAAEEAPEEAASLTTDVGDTAAATRTGAGTASEGSVTDGAARTINTGVAAENARRAADDTARRTAGAAQQLVANCDTARKVIKIPSWGAPPCVQRFSGSNAGSSYQGVTKDTIKVVFYIAQENPAADAILKAAGADDSEEDVRRQVLDWVQLYQAHFNMWGRKTEVVFVNGSGAATDDAAAKADAIKVATQIKAFASLNAPNNTYVEELVARGVMCMCTVELPNRLYQKWAPYVWGLTLQSADQTYDLLTEYMAKRLAGKNAQWAGDPLMQDDKRVFGLLQYETRDFAYGSAADYFVRKLAAHGIKLVVAKYNGYPDLTANQQQARPVIQRMKEAGVTTLICGCDPFAPIFFTQEATRQLYRPEWIVTGSALTDTSFFGRTYDPDQWSHAYGLGQLTARLPESLSDSYRLLRWHFNKEPAAAAGYAVIRSPIDVFYRGVHMAGPALTPKTFEAGMFAHPVIGKGMKTVASMSWGKQVWPFNDYTGFDDVTEIWWDPTARGEDEIGNDRTPGMYRYVDGGKRYLPGQWPRTNPKVFNRAGATTVYQNYPPGEAPPQYPRPK